ncbi:protein-L-isoaspartate(D-aspartate) O-methyltransferase [Keratinibaculum paraultunense]|uniref:Protein-L-isoaspartate O-methyltransferase n=1 Tax=Keratinibaculum paraultunense TaxID=1278232 RepID=A0A4R3L1Y4_9FIRM|nr:protein-L-isoaspartate(D-aspartate) O-methyltransferase [Keratinibaculum paraultunense]QQY79947.1 protein-L-isoaspartate(D-aspartate) O-methyltransferase [Keratinibaculum paraultunense]TCS91733.1 protein-L-isoaspartate(D-aspartate) O-methyltransferase [Keratinibaculum paraultunense]
MRFFGGIFYDIEDERVIEAIRSIPRELFVPDEFKDYAYVDSALPIGYGQTISQPSLVAYMTQLLELDKNKEVLEIGTGSGYQTALLAKLAKKVYTVEIIEELQKRAKKILDKLGLDNIKYKIGNGYEGWEEYAPYDAIMVTAAPPEVPEKLLEQLKDSGKMVIPVGKPGHTQVLKLIIREGDKFIEEDLQYVRFVPMVK